MIQVRRPVVTGPSLAGGGGLWRPGLACALGFGGLLPPSVPVGRPLGIVKFVRFAVPIFEECRIHRVTFKPIAANPGFAARTAPRVVDESDRHTKLIVQLAPEEI